MHLFYTPDVRIPRYQLPEEEAKHCIRVLRLSEGDPLSLIDGRGGLYHCRIFRIDGKQCEVECIEKIKHFGQRPFRVHIAIAPTKNIERLEWFLEKATEIGIDRITPLLCDHSERKVIKTERLEKIIISAMKQSYKAYLPQLDPLTPFGEFIRAEGGENREASNSSIGRVKAIAHCEAGEKRGIADIYPKGGDITILIGPEGDFSPAEITLAQTAGFQPVTLGESRLRTETAGIVACHSVHFINQ